MIKWNVLHRGAKVVNLLPEHNVSAQFWIQLLLNALHALVYCAYADIIYEWLINPTWCSSTHILIRHKSFGYRFCFQSSTLSLCLCLFFLSSLADFLFEHHRDCSVRKYIKYIEKLFVKAEILLQKQSWHIIF